MNTINVKYNKITSAGGEPNLEWKEQLGVKKYILFLHNENDNLSLEQIHSFKNDVYCPLIDGVYVGSLVGIHNAHKPIVFQINQFEVKN